MTSRAHEAPPAALKPLQVDSAAAAAATIRTIHARCAMTPRVGRGGSAATRVSDDERRAAAATRLAAALARR